MSLVLQSGSKLICSASVPLRPRKNFKSFAQANGPRKAKDVAKGSALKPLEVLV